jgi:hypothetical protein
VELDFDAPELVGEDLLAARADDGRGVVCGAWKRWPSGIPSKLQE